MQRVRRAMPRILKDAVMWKPRGTRGTAGLVLMEKNTTRHKRWFGSAGFGGSRSMCVPVGWVRVIDAWYSYALPETVFHMLYRRVK